MATMIPSTISSDTESGAERRLFAEFERQLPCEYHVFHSVAWQLRDKKRGVTDGEADFVIAHPNWGILILEVKGGAISRTGVDGRWFSGSNEIKDPCRQANRCKFSLINKLKERPYWKSRFVPAEYAVGFPDVAVGDLSYGLGLRLPHARILDVRNLTALAEWAERAFETLQDQHTYPIGRAGIQDLLSCLAPEVHFAVELQPWIRQARNAIARLTDDQFRTLEVTKRLRKVRVSGCAGSGKTLVAIEKAIRLSKDGFRTLFLCQNPHLASDVKHRTDGTALHVSDFATWVHAPSDCQNAILPSWTLFDEPTEAVLDAAFDRLTSSEDARYDAVVVDEAQDFRDDWWYVVEAALKSPQDGILYLFHDDNQSLTPRGSHYPIDQPHLHLSRNCRNSGAVFNLVGRLHPQAPEPSQELTGLGKIVPHIVANGREAVGLTNAVADALREVQLKDIAVLTVASHADLSAAEVRIAPAWRWQDAVRSYFKRLGGRRLHPSGAADDLMLSDSPVPTDTDLEAVRRHFLPLCGPPPTEYHLHRLRWREDSSQGGTYGEIFPPSSPAKVAAFLASSEWATSLPREHVYRFANDGEVTDDATLRLWTVDAFKGLEADVIILYCASSMCLTKERLYVGISRARHTLHLVVPSGARKTVERLLGEPLTHIQE